MIQVENVSMHYYTRQGRRTVLDRINLTLHKGQNVGILGRNGAGKSTLVRLLAGAVQPTSGRIHRTMRVSWPLAFNVAFQQHLTGMDNLKFFCRGYGVPHEPLVQFVEQVAVLGIYFREPVALYSSGMITRPRSIRRRRPCMRTWAAFAGAAGIRRFPASRLPVPPGMSARGTSVPTRAAAACMEVPSPPKTATTSTPDSTACRASSRASPGPVVVATSRPQPPCSRDRASRRGVLSLVRAATGLVIRKARATQ